MVKEPIFTITEINTLGLGLKIASREEVLWKWKLAIHTQANGKIVKNMAREFIDLEMMTFMKENFMME